jgi:tetratricopeptide (TPR) repeat protein
MKRPTAGAAFVPARGLARRTSIRWLLGGLAVTSILGGCRSSEDAMLRGDRYWADSNYVAALAEYRLAARQTGRVEADVRVAHAYVQTGQLDRARATYEKLTNIDPSYADQAIFDYLTLARSSLQRGDRYGAARAAEAAHALRPGLAMPEMAITLARYYATIGDADRALQFYHRAISTGDPGPRLALLYEIASLTERSGNCVDALPYFRAFSQESEHQDSVTEARWRMGACGLERGRRAREEGNAERALELLQITVELGAPQNLLDQAWFERGEALLTLGRTEDAQLAFERVVELSPSGRTPLAARAIRRLDELRASQVP